MKTYAVVMWGELRTIPLIIENFKKNLLDELKADLYVIVQKTGLPTDENIKLLSNDNGLVYQYMYDKPSNFNDIYPSLSTLGNQYNCINCNENGTLNLYNNWSIIDDLIGYNLEKEYEYIILTRSDYNHILPFPDIKNIVDIKYNDTVWSYEGCDWEGINMNMRIVPNTLIRNVLTQVSKFLNSPLEHYEIKDKYFNIEKLIDFIYKKQNIVIGRICNTGFIIANDRNDRTTWGPILYSDKHKVYYKYHENLEFTFESYNLYMNEKKIYKMVYNDKYNCKYIGLF